MQRKRESSRRKTASGSRSAKPQRLEILGSGRLDRWQQAADRRPWLSVSVSFLLIVAALTLWRWSILDSPPYWDSAMGLCLEANYLADTDFDYHHLFTTEKRFNEGGSAIYLISVLPTVMALLMTRLPTPAAAFVAYRLLSFAATAVLLLFVCAILKPRTGRLGAWLVCLALVTTPSFAAQIDLIGMDLPIATWGVACAWLLLRRNYVAVAGLSLLAFFTKLTGGLLALAAIPLIILLLSYSWWRHDRRAERACWIGLSANLLVVCAQIVVVTAVMNLNQSAAETYKIDPSQGMQSLEVYAQLVPDLAVMLIVTLVAWLVVSIRRFRSRAAESNATESWNRVLDGLAAVTLDQPLAIYGWTIIFGMLAGLLLTYVIPRYLTLPLPFLLMILGTLLFSRQKSRPLAAAAMVLLIGFNVLNLDGRFLPRFPDAHPTDWRTGALLERSREYLKDHRQNLEAVRRLVRRCGETRIVAPPPFAHLLSLPRLGYVDKPLRGYSLHTYTNKHFVPIERLRDDPPSDLTFIFVMNRFYGLVLLDKRVSLPPPTPRDRFIYTAPPLAKGRPQPGLMIYQKSDALRLTGIAKKRFYLDSLWPTGDELHEAKQLLAQKNYDEATELYARILAKNPCQLEARFQLASLLAMGGRLPEARQQYETFLDQQPTVATAHRNLAQILTELGDQVGAERHLRAALRLEPSLVDARGELGVVLFRQHKFEAALEELERAVRSGGDERQFGFFAGLALRALGHDRQAAARWRKVIASSGGHAASYFELAQLESDAGRFDEAIADYQRASEANPQWIDPLNHLAWLRATHPEAQFRRGDQAVELAERMIELAGRERGDLLDTLAAAYAEAGRFAEAVETAQAAIERARAAGNRSKRPNMNSG